jgi:hypothetical protein
MPKSKGSRGSRGSRGSKSPSPKNPKGERISSFATCIRQISATVPYKKRMLFNAPEGTAPPDPLVLSQMSSKFATLVETIRLLDAEDMKRHGTLFKHFIFTDIRKSVFGAKAIASFLQAHGFELLLKAERGFRRVKVKAANGSEEFKMVPTKKLKITLGTHQPVEGGSNRVGLLQSAPMWRSPLGVEIRKQMLGIFNSRPDNIHGEQIRIMVLDSKFKEGIDLYDVKYVHLMEPQITEADLKQAVGRATRFCGQRGLSFIPNTGWPLDVYLYETQFANAYPFRVSGDQRLFDAHKYMLTHSGLDLGLLEMTRDLTVLAIKTAVDYDLTYKVSNFKLQTDILNLTDLDDTITVVVSPTTGGAVRAVPTKGLDFSKCVPRSNKFFPFTVANIRKALKGRGVYVPSKVSREWICKALQANEEAVQDLITTRRAQFEAAQKAAEAKTVQSLEVRPRTPDYELFPRVSRTGHSKSPGKTPSLDGFFDRSVGSVDVEPRTPDYELFPRVSRTGRRGSSSSSAETPSLQGFYESVGSPASTARSTDVEPRTPYYELFPRPSKPVRLSKEEIEEMPDLADFFGAAEMAAEMHYTATRVSFAEFQRYIAKKYAEFRWQSPVVASGCDVAPQPGKAVVFSKSQDFVRHYLTPASPFRGLLAWHSVGTGKTCTAVATATSEFEKQGYTILWVTRNSLVADVWKNMFGAVCSIPMQERLAAGKKLPEKLGLQKRLVSKQWFEPISYRTLQNAVVPVAKGAKKGQVTKLGQELQKRNGKADPLRRTFLIIDEVHKLLDGDLKASEMADFEKIAGAIQNSYRQSGEDSVRLLLMTATPITDNPEGLFKLLNLLIPEATRRLPTVDEFRERFTNKDGKISGEGVAFFQDRTKGLISYLNREFDPSTFAQPRFHRLQIPATGAMLPTDEEIVRGCWDAEMSGEPDEVEVDCGALEGELAEALADLEEYDFPPKELVARQKTLRADYKRRMGDCKKSQANRTRRMKTRVGKVQQCAVAAAKLRKQTYRLSQQKAVRSCFGKFAYGKLPKFSGVGELRKLSKRGRPKTVAAAEGPMRSRSPTPRNRAPYVKNKTRRGKDRKGRRSSRNNNDNNSNNSNNSSNSNRNNSNSNNNND